MKVYYAHGFAVRNNFPADGDEVWQNNSSFGKVFGDFESAKNYLLSCFEERLENIYACDERFAPGIEERRAIHDKTGILRREYICECVFYNLLVSEIDADIWRGERDPNAPDEIVWHIRYNGEVSSRYLIFGDKEYEFRPSDESDGAGKKFKAGDMVRCADREDDRSGDMFVVYETPQIAEEGGIWQNHYTVLRVGLHGRRPVVSAERFHEADLALCLPEDSKRAHYAEQLAALRNAITGKVVLPKELWNEILRGRIIFNACPSWRDIPELFGKHEHNL